MAIVPSGAKTTLRVVDGSSAQVSRPPHVDDDQWAEMRAYLESNPEEAREWEEYSRNPEAYRNYLRAQAVTDFYQQKLDDGDEGLLEKINQLESDWELASILDDVKRNGVEAAKRYTKDDDLMVKVSDKMGGLSGDVQESLQRVESMSLNVHEAARDGHLGDVTAFVSREVRRGENIDLKDNKGISILGNAVAANRTSVVKLLLKNKANPDEVDNEGNSAVHYAAAYGRPELLEYFLDAGMDVNKRNNDGKTPMALATQNRTESTLRILRSKKAV